MAGVLLRSEWCQGRSGLRLEYNWAILEWQLAEMKLLVLVLARIELPEEILVNVLLTDQGLKFSKLAQRKLLWQVACQMEASRGRIKNA
ncbi:hypothetical protein Nepgr_021192 [Nepenthes gracilis]|uniref:Uncharacterized protein n=1 Tax=Nepenthes gracilis TaxID=150966 RepID=A0AAD3XX42_NEPGR|nr:hypothetical protein Nepgr_021192 [Nepenthes gracilis]